MVYSPDNAYCELISMVMKEATHKRRPLDGDGCQEHVQPHAAEPVAPQEHHEKPKANEDHDVYVLKH